MPVLREAMPVLRQGSGTGAAGNVAGVALADDPTLLALEQILAPVLHDDPDAALAAFVDHAARRLGVAVGVVVHPTIGARRQAAGAGGAELLERVGTSLLDRPGDDAAGVWTVVGPAGRELGWMILGPPHVPPPAEPELIAGLRTLLTVVLAHHTAYGSERRRSTSDPLTAVGNRLALDEALWAAARRAEGVWSMICVEFVVPPSVGEDHGDDAVDEILVVVSRRLRAVVRADDLVAREESCEFLVLCPGLSATDAVRLSGRIDAAIGEPISLTTGAVSVPVVVATATAQRPAEVYGLAERVLGAARRTVDAHLPRLHVVREL